MPNEVYYQRKIIQQVKQEGGYAKKWASQWTVGPPDLIIVHPEAGSMFMEVKLLNKPVSGFNVKLGLTGKQELELDRIHSARGVALVGVVVARGPGDASLCVLPYNATRLSETKLDEVRGYGAVFELYAKHQPAKNYGMLGQTLIRGILQCPSKQS